MLPLLLLSTLFSPGFGQPGRLSEIPKGTALHLCRDLGNRTRFQETLKPLLVPRIVGTLQHKQVGQYIHDFFASLGWSTEWDSFLEETPIGMKNFHNLIVSLDEKASKYLVLACHYDSKIIEGQRFVGATDSAVPCAMILDLAKVLTTALKQRKNKDIGLKMIFFDGEEAFVEWTDEDSLYGARHLASKWAGQLDKIAVMMLLDLLGAENPRIPNREYGAEGLFADLIKIEEDVLRMGCGEAVSKAFTSVYGRTRIEDDHKPFLDRGVPILHLISTPFPAVWHTVGDDESALHYPTIDHLNSILRIFIAKYFNIATI